MGPVVGPLAGLAGVEGAEVGHGVGAGLAPAHPGALEAAADHLLARRLHRARADLPAAPQVVRIVHAVRLVLEVHQRRSEALAQGRAVGQLQFAEELILNIISQE